MDNDNLYLPSREDVQDAKNTVEYPPIGLDFGTSNSVLAHYTDEFHRRGAYAYALPLLNGGNVFPSIVYYNNEQNRYETGTAAKIRQLIESEAVATSIKRKISLEYIDIAGRNVSPIDLMSYIISGLLREVRSTELTMMPTVITMTVPYYFKQSQNYRLQQAAKQAFNDVFGKEYKIEVIPEPVAAAIDYICNRNTRRNISQTILIYDIGGGTCDVTIVRYSLSGSRLEFEVLGIDGDETLGGDDIDHLLFEYICNENNIDIDKLHSEPRYTKTIATLLDDARSVKESLSIQEDYNLVRPSLYVNNSYINIDTVITRQVLNDILRNQKRPKKNDSVIDALDAAIKRLKLKTHNVKVDLLLPIGGTSSIPVVQKVVKDNYPDSEHVNLPNIDSQVSVARGAAIYSALHDQRNLHPLGQSIHDISIKMRVAHSLSVAMYDGRLVKLINSNSPAPYKATKRFYATRSDASKQFIKLSTIELYQGEGRTTSSENVELVGRIDLSKYQLYTHDRDLKDIPFQVTFKADATNLEAQIIADGVNQDKTDLIINETIKL
ncbi:MAG: Hsp70 family protein [Rikenellaceae bacterium]|nr:Hsp70 family protein [Rikenellaceae bacterium]